MQNRMKERLAGGDSAWCLGGRHAWLKALRVLIRLSPGMWAMGKVMS